MQELGVPLENPAYHREWAEGISVYTSLEYAIKRARATNFAQGDHVVPVCIPDGSPIAFRQTFSNRRYFTISTYGAWARSLVCGETISAPEHEHD